MEWLDSFRHVWLVDFEFCQPDGELASPVCMVGRDLKSGQLVRLWQDELARPPFEITQDSLFVAYYSSAEWNCHLSLGWPLPLRILDLYAEFRCLTSGKTTPCGPSLLGALSYFGLDGIDSSEKDAMRNLVMRGGPWSASEQQSILDYCQSDVDALARLLPAMLPHIDLPRALLRGRYMAAAARMEFTGVPIDIAALGKLRSHWDAIQDQLIGKIDKDYCVYDGRTFKTERWERWVDQQSISWPRLPSGTVALDDDTFKEMAETYPQVRPIRELRKTLSQMRLNELAVGSDRRNRCLLSAFASQTGRNQPSNAKFIFGTAAWLRGLIRPVPGRAIAYLDYEQQEFGIAAALSGDRNMMRAYESGDPYLAFAKQAGAVPADATKHSHANEREQFKGCSLAVQYGMEAVGLAKKLDACPALAKELLRLHRLTYPQYWRWSDGIRDCAVMTGKLQAVFGWSVHVTEKFNPRSLRNFPLQANGGEMLRLACCLATERGIRVCCPVHDALLIEAESSRIAEAIQSCQEAMEEASRIVLNGFTIKTDAKIVTFPDRYLDKRGETMWRAVSELVGGFDE